MNQVSPKLRRSQNGYMHYCPACDELHPLPNSWTFNGNLNKPTFTPSFKHEGLKCVFVEGKWTGEWQRDQAGNPIKFVCHYILTDGILNYCGDCTHALSNMKVELPNLPEYYRD